MLDIKFHSIDISIDIFEGETSIISLIGISENIPLPENLALQNAD